MCFTFLNIHLQQCKSRLSFVSSVLYKPTSHLNFQNSYTVSKVSLVHYKMTLTVKIVLNVYKNKHKIYQI